MDEDRAIPNSVDNPLTVGASRMIDAEVICMWMEPDAPENGGKPNVEILNKYSPLGWWRYNGLACSWKLPILVACQNKRELLGYLWEVEERLTDEQWSGYASLMMDPAGVHHTRFLLHATPAQKTKALATVLLTVVEHPERKRETSTREGNSV